MGSDSSEALMGHITQSVKDEVTSGKVLGQEAFWYRNLSCTSTKEHEEFSSQALHLCKERMICKNGRSTEALDRKWDTFQLSTCENAWGFSRKISESIQRTKRSSALWHLDSLKWKSTSVKQQIYPWQILVRNQQWERRFDATLDDRAKQTRKANGQADHLHKWC